MHRDSVMLTPTLPKSVNTNRMNGIGMQTGGKIKKETLFYYKEGTIFTFNYYLNNFKNYDHLYGYWNL